MPGSTLKRQRAADDNDEIPEASRSVRQRKQKKKDSKPNHSEAAVESPSPAYLARILQTRLKQTDPDLTELELERKRFIGADAIVDTSQWKAPRDLAGLPDFLREFSKRGEGAGGRARFEGRRLSGAPPRNGCPHTLVITGAAMRAADLARTVRGYFESGDDKHDHDGDNDKHGDEHGDDKDREGNSDGVAPGAGIVAKMFAKHIKLSAAISHARRTRISVGVGTPGRVLDLVDAEAVRLTDLERIVVDSSHLDQKRRSILDMAETLAPLLRLLGREGIVERLGNGVDLLFY